MTPKSSSGFTLIELIIVIIIISIVATIAMTTIGRNQKKEVETLGKQMNNLLSLASEEAMLRTATLGLAFTPTSFQFYLYQERKGVSAWSPITKPPLNLHQFSNNIKITLIVNGKEMSLNGHPFIIISQSGDITPFKLVLGTEKMGAFYQVTETGSRYIEREAAHEK